MLVFKRPIDVRSGKPGRFLSVFNVGEIEAAIGGTIAYVYTNTLDPGSVAGNHFHRRKREAMVGVAGKLELWIRPVGEDESLGPIQQLVLETQRFGGNLVVVPPMVAHAVVNRSSSTGVVMVFATEEPRIKDDDFDAIVADTPIHLVG